MASISEIEERIHEPSNPTAQHVYDGFSKRQSRPWSALVLGATAVGLVLVLILGSVFGLWLLRSVRRLNLQVAHLNRQTEQLNQRLQGAEQHVKSLDQKVSQPAPAQAAIRTDQAPDQVKQPDATLAARAESPLQSEAAAQPPNQTAHKTEENRTQRADELQKLKESLGQIAETRRTADGVVMTLGEKSLRFDSGKSTIAPQYRAILSRIAGVLMPLKGCSIYVYGYTDDSGTKEYNLKLSASRARSVRAALVKAGVDPSLISAKGLGKSKPLVRASNANALAVNRRVEIGIVYATLVSSKPSPL